MCQVSEPSSDPSPNVVQRVVADINTTGNTEINKKLTVIFVYMHVQLYIAIVHT